MPDEQHFIRGCAVVSAACVVVVASVMVADPTTVNAWGVGAYIAGIVAVAAWATWEIAR